MMHLLAQADSSSLTSALWIGIIVLALSNLVGLAISVMTFMRMAGGKDGERQVEPTAMHAIQSELQGQTATLNKLDREMGGVLTNVKSIQHELSEAKATHTNELAGAHRRIDGISREAAATAARVDGLEKRETA